MSVISGKKNLSIILVTQNYYMQGKHSRDIRNSCNYVALFRNCCDLTLNRRVARDFGLLGACIAAEESVFMNKIHPYIFIDQTQAAQLSQFRLYIDILGTFRVAFNNEKMKGYIIPESEFKKVFTILEKNNFAVKAGYKYADKKEKLPGIYLFIYLLVNFMMILVAEPAKKRKKTKKRSQKNSQDWVGVDEYQ